MTTTPFGMRDIKLTPLIGSTDLLGIAVDLPISRTLTFAETEDFEDLRGDDGLAATHGNGPAVDWSMEAGGVSLESVRVMYGGTLTETGVTPNIKRTLNKKGRDQRGYFRIEGQAMSDSGGDFHLVIYKAKATGELSGEMSEGSWWLTGASGRGLPDANDDLWDFVENETAEDIQVTSNEVQNLVIDATAGQWDAAHAHADIADLNDVAWNVSVVALQALMDTAAGPDNIIVSGVPGNYLLSYRGDFAGTNMAQWVISDGTTPLSGGSASGSCTTLVQGG
jgi:hypothetical protein